MVGLKHWFAIACLGLMFSCGLVPQITNQTQGTSPGLTRTNLAPESTDAWRSFCLVPGCAHPHWWLNSSGEMELKAQSTGLQGILMKVPLQGHFTNEARLHLGDNRALARGLILFPVQSSIGAPQPDLDTYLALMLDRDDQGHWRIKARDRQTLADGSRQEQVLDRTGRLSPWEQARRYEAILDGTFSPAGSLRNDFRVPFKESSGQLKMFHHVSSLQDGKEQPFFHLAYAVRKHLMPTIGPAEGWMNLAPVPSWADKAQHYFIGLVLDAHKAGDQVRFRDMQTYRLPSSEPAQESQTFEVTQKSYHWSGFAGDAWQVQFGRRWPASRRYRLVFWSELNNVPAWHINDQLLVTNSFVELWPENRQKSPGCFEAMADNLRWNNEVRIIADHPARKIIHWRSYLMNPAYQTIAQTLGKEPKRGLEAQARSDEYWTIYPDGSTFREIVYSPDDEGYGANAFEIAELSIIAGSRSNPEHHAQPGASLELWNPMKAESFRFRPSQGRDMDGKSYSKGQAPFDRWEHLAAVVRVKDGDDHAPYIYSAFAQAGSAPHVSGAYPLIYDVSWHGYEWQFSHWPIHREPYEYHDQTRTTWDAQVSHSSLVSVQVSHGGRSPGPKSFVSLLGIHPDPHVISSRIQEWAYPPLVHNLQGCDSPSHNPRRGHLELQWNNSPCSFELTSRLKDRDAMPLVLVLRDVQPHQLLKLFVNGKEAAPDLWSMGYEYEDRQSRAVLYIDPQPGGIRSITVR